MHDRAPGPDRPVAQRRCARDARAKLCSGRKRRQAFVKTTGRTWVALQTVAKLRLAKALQGAVCARAPLGLGASQATGRRSATGSTPCRVDGPSRAAPTDLAFGIRPMTEALDYTRPCGASGAPRRGATRGADKGPLLPQRPPLPLGTAAMSRPYSSDKGRYRKWHTFFVNYTLHNVIRKCNIPVAAAAGSAGRWGLRVQGVGGGHPRAAPAWVSGRASMQPHRPCRTHRTATEKQSGNPDDREPRMAY